MLNTKSKTLAYLLPVLLWALAFTRAAPAQEASTIAKPDASVADKKLRQFLESWSGRLGEIKGLEIHFRQEKQLKILRRPLVSRGKIRLVEGRLLCEVVDSRGDLESAVLVSEKTLKIHYPKLRVVEIYDLNSAHTPAMAFPIFGADTAGLERDFSLTLERLEPEEGKDRQRLTLKPRDPEAPVGSMVLTFVDLEVREVQQLDRKGNRVTLKIEKSIANPEIEASELRLELPAGTREVRPLGGGG